MRLPYWSILLFLVVTGLLMSSQAVAQLTFDPTALRFGEVVPGQSETLTVTMTNSGSSSLTLSTVSVNPAAYTLGGMTLPLTLAAGQSAGFTVTFTPAVVGEASGSIAFNTTLATLNVRGYGVSSQSLTANPASLAFANTPTGTAATMLVTLTNAENASVTISQASTSTQFAITGLPLPLTLEAGHSFTFTMTFSPTSVGPVSSVFKGLGSAGNLVVYAPLTGTGVAPGQLTLNPTSFNFGNVTVGTSANQPATLTATGASVTVSAATSSNSEFAFSGLSLPITIGAGQSAAYTATFTPQSSGTTSATISFANNSSNSNTSQSLTGTGVSAQDYTVTLSWTASTSQVVGYNVYRGNTSGGPYSKINSALDSVTTYTDGSVADGQTYYYVTTAVNSGGEESAYSNQTQAVIP